MIMPLSMSRDARRDAVGQAEQVGAVEAARRGARDIAMIGHYCWRWMLRRSFSASANR
jgi:hypothetical protein